jgi:hypothetical protein
METISFSPALAKSVGIAELKYQGDIQNARQKDEEELNPKFEPFVIKNNPAQIIIVELTGYLQTIQEFDKDAGQDGTALHQYLIQLTNFQARSNFLMATYKKKFRDEKKETYLKLIASSNSQQKFFGISLAKDYVDSQCSETGFVYDLAERCSRTCMHTQAAVITIISSLKSEWLNAKYNS